VGPAPTENLPATVAPPRRIWLFFKVGESLNPIGQLRTVFRERGDFFRSHRGSLPAQKESSCTVPEQNPQPLGGSSFCALLMRSSMVIVHVGPVNPRSAAIAVTAHHFATFFSFSWQVDGLNFGRILPARFSAVTQCHSNLPPHCQASRFFQIRSVGGICAASALKKPSDIVSGEAKLLFSTSSVVARPNSRRASLGRLFYVTGACT